MADALTTRLQMCEDVIRDNPYSHPVTTAWYYEDVTRLRELVEAVAGDAYLYGLGELTAEQAIESMGATAREALAVVQDTGL